MAQIVLHALVLFLFTFRSAIAEGLTFNVVSFGAKPDGETDSTNAFLSAWGRACSSTTPTTIYVPLGRFLVGNAVFKGRCNKKGITIRIDGALVAPSNYDVIGNAGNWLFFDDVMGFRSLVVFLMDKAQACGHNLGFTNSNNVVINGVTSLNSQMFHIVIDRCENVKVQGVKVSAAGNSPNTDGIHVQLSSSVTILNSNIPTRDDCISIGPGTTNLWIENIACGPGHGISVGSLGKEFQEPDVQNVTVKTVTFTGTENGVRIKSWGRPSSGFARNILFQHATMVNVQNPIVIDQSYCPNEKNCPGQVSGVE
ncbi:Polygalacturonase protein [Spatholobus suberectus]|nr:Polygalacturonase protein [Spatholobus suberectus]